jgi:hypothetical protein
MSYGRGMGQHLGLILRPPTRTWGFRGLRFMYEPPTPRMSRVARLGRLRGLADSGYSDPVTGEWIDTSTLPLTPPSWSNIPLVPLAPAATPTPFTAYQTFPLAPPTPSNVPLVPLPAPASAQMAMPSWLTPQNLLIGGGLILGFALLSGGGRRRR